jgi:carnitine 3-dehydrogenase
MDEAAGSRGIVTPYEGDPARPWDDSAAIPAPLDLHETTVVPAWVDYNDHMSESSYLLAFGDGADAFFRYVGIDERYRSGGHSLYTAETHLHHLGEAVAGDRLRLTLQVLDVDAKRVHVFHRMSLRDPDDTGDPSDTAIATAEQMLLHVDTATGRVTPLPPYLSHRLEAVRRAHAALPRPEQVGHVMGIPRPGASR